MTTLSLVVNKEHDYLKSALENAFSMPSTVDVYVECSKCPAVQKPIFKLPMFFLSFSHLPGSDARVWASTLTHTTQVNNFIASRRLFWDR